MRTSVALLLAFAVTCRAQLFLKDGMEYQFDSEVSASAGSMDYATHSSGYSYKSKTRMQVNGDTMNIKMSDVKMSQFTGAHKANEWAFDRTTFQSIGREPLPFSITLDGKGLVERITVPSEANVFQRNMAKAWAAQFQMNSAEIKSGKLAFKSKEKLIQGDCDVTYTVTGDKVIKNVAHMSDCENLVMRKVSNYGFHKCESSQPKNPDSVASTTYVLKTNDDGSKMIQAIVSTGTYMAQIFEEEGAAFFVYTNATHMLTGVESSSGDISVSGDSISDMSYEFHDANMKWNVDRDLKKADDTFQEMIGLSANEMKEKVRTIIDGQADIMATLSPDDKESISKAHENGINMIGIYMRSLGYDDLMSLADEYLGDKTETGMMKGNIFGESLSSTGSAPSAMAVLDLVLANRFDNDRDASRILTSVPFHMRRPNTQLVKVFEKLLTTNFEGRFMTMAAPLTFAHMARQTCTLSGNREEMMACNDNMAAKYQERFFNDFKNTDDHNEKLNILAAMDNLAWGSVATLLKPLIFGQMEKCQHLRTRAIWTAADELIATKKGAEYLRPIFADTSLSHEMRISALEIMLMSKPTAADMSSIMVVLYREPDFEVINYAYTLFERYAISVDPCDHQMANMCAYFLKYMKQYSDFEADWGLGASKTYQRQYYQKRYGYGGTYGFYVIGSEQSTAPVSLGMHMDGTLGTNRHAQMIAVHLSIQGLSKMIVRKLKQTDPSTWKTDDLKKILTDMSIRERPDQKVRAMISIRVKGVVVLNRVYSEEDFTGEGKISSFLDNLKGLGDQYSLNHQRAIRLGGFSMEMPTNIGHPMYLGSSMTSLISLKATVKRGNHRGLLFRDVTYKLNVLTQGERIATVINPMTKSMYGIFQDRIYHVSVPRNVVIGVNPIKKELKLSVSRPPHDDPQQAFMHSQTKVFALFGQAANNLKSNCPSCENMVTVSRGPDAIGKRVIADRENQKYGSYLRAEYFDCEMDISRKNTFGRGLAAFMPYNKSPKTPWTFLTMGVRQIRDFFFYYPRNEQCGMFVRWSQSKNNPVKGIELTLRGNVEPNGSKQFFNGRKWYIKALLKAKGEPVNRQYRINVGYEFSPSNVYNKLKVQINRSPVPELGIEPLSICAAYESKYPDLGKEFISFEPDQILENTGKAMIQYGEGSSCADTDGEIKLTFKHSTTDYAQKDLKNKWYYKQCMAQKNTLGWRSHESLPVSEPCYMTIWDSTMARKYSWKVEFVKLTDRMKSIISKVQAAVRAGLMPYWDIDPEELGTDGSVGPFLNVGVEFKNNEKNADITLETSQGKEEFSEVPLRLEWTRRLRQLKYSKSLVDLYYSKIINPCVVSTGDIRTMDNVTMAYEAPSCWTLASATCGPNPHYAVFSKKSGDGLAVRAYFGGHLVELNPNGGVKINGAAVNVPDNGQHVEESAGTEIFKMFRWGNTYNIHSTLRLWVSYDGHYVQVIPAPSTKGQHCGICGNYNRNPMDELTGRNMEQFKNVDEFVADWKETC